MFCNDNFKKVLHHLTRRNTVGTLIIKDSKTNYPEETRGKAKSTEGNLKESKEGISPVQVPSGPTQSTSTSKASGKAEPRVFVISD